MHFCKYGSSSVVNFSKITSPPTLHRTEKTKNKSTGGGHQKYHTMLLTLLRGGQTRSFARAFSSNNTKEPFVLLSKQAGVTTMTMNRPKQLNGWTEGMMKELQIHFQHCSQDPDTKVAVLTGTGAYYCAGVNLSGTFKPQHPAKLHSMIQTQNQMLFELFLDFPKPIIAAVNGPAIGASVTSATLCDALLASDTATFSTPFARLGVPPEGCSSVNFERFMGRDNANRMMGEEAWVPTSEEAVEIGLATKAVAADALQMAAQQLGESWIATNKQRSLPHTSIERGGADLMHTFKLVNAEESALLADAFTSEKFLEGQRAFLSSKGKTMPALVFAFAKFTRPLWSQLLPPPYVTK